MAKKSTTKQADEKPDTPKDEVEKKDNAAKDGIEYTAEEILLTKEASRVQFGNKEIIIKPMSLKTALKIGKFITKNFGRAFNGESFQKAKSGENITEVEMWSGVVTEFLSALEEEEIMDLLCDITGEDQKEIEKNFSLAGLAGVIRALVLTEDFEQIFLEVRIISNAGKKMTQ
jgi:hypothetical protein